MNYFEDLNPYLVREDTSQPDPMAPSTTTTTAPTMMNETYTENILRLNIGKLGTFYFTYTGSTEWRDRVYKGILEQAGRDHFVIRDPKTNRRYLLATIYYVWSEFDEELSYSYPYQK